MQDFIRFISLIAYLGFIISSITGFINSSDDGVSAYTISFITASIVLLIQNIAYIIVEMCRTYENSPNVSKNIYYIRSILIIQSSILSIGVSDVGIGFGIFGMLIFIVNLLAGVFNTDNRDMRVSPYSAYEEQNE